MPTKLDEAREQLARANRMIANEGVLDAFGHVSIRHPGRPDRYLMSRNRSPAIVERALRYAPACALVAIIVPSVLTRDHEVFLSVRNYQLWAVVVGTLVFIRYRNMLALMGVVMGVFTALRLLA